MWLSNGANPHIGTAERRLANRIIVGQEGGGAAVGRRGLRPANATGAGHCGGAVNGTALAMSVLCSRGADNSVSDKE